MFEPPCIIRVRRLILPMRNKIFAGSPEGTRPLGDIHKYSLRDILNYSLNLKYYFRSMQKY